MRFGFTNLSRLLVKDSVWFYIHQNEAGAKLWKLEDTACAYCPSSF
jgi:hypothetical protein